MDSERKYIIKEIFYSLQGEGFHSGRPAIFVRFSGCNLNCPFCDTDFRGGEFLSLPEIIKRITKVAKDCRFIVFTGGEPTLQLTKEIIDELHNQSFELAMETNGTNKFPEGIDWVTLSPKIDFCNYNLFPNKRIADEVKIVFDGKNDPLKFSSMGLRKYVQPCDTGSRLRNNKIINETIDWLKKHPDWALSLQIHKVLKIS